MKKITYNTYTILIAAGRSCSSACKKDFLDLAFRKTRFRPMRHGKTLRISEAFVTNRYIRGLCEGGFR